MPSRELCDRLEPQTADPGAVGRPHPSAQCQPPDGDRHLRRGRPRGRNHGTSHHPVMRSFLGHKKRALARPGRAARHPTNNRAQPGPVGLHNVQPADEIERVTRVSDVPAEHDRPARLNRPHHTEPARRATGSALASRGRDQQRDHGAAQHRQRNTGGRELTTRNSHSPPNRKKRSPPRSNERTRPHRRRPTRTTAETRR